MPIDSYGMPTTPTKKKKTSSEPSVGEAPTLSPPPSFGSYLSQNSVAGRMANTGSDVMPVWAGMKPPSAPMIFPEDQAAAATDPATPAATGDGAYPPPQGPPKFHMPGAPPEETGSAFPNGWAAANPMASATGGEMFGAPVRQGIFRDLYRIANHQPPSPATQTLMGIGKPPMGGMGGSPMSGFPPDTTGMPGFPQPPQAQRPLPQRPPSPQPPMNLGTGPQQPHQFPSRAGRMGQRLMNRPRPQGPMGSQRGPGY